jgi:hypothetical protein
MLQTRIREEFAQVPFPEHCGLHAAVAKDDWIDDEKTLREITLNKDYVGEWWNVPIEHLVECMMALSYFDASGMEYYLPAYMNAIVSNPEAFDVPRKKSSSWQVVYTMLPDTEDPELVQHFHEQFNNIQGGKRQVVIDFYATSQTAKRTVNMQEKLQMKHWLMSTGRAAANNGLHRTAKSYSALRSAPSRSAFGFR